MFNSLKNDQEFTSLGHESKHRIKLQSRIHELVVHLRFHFVFQFYSSKSVFADTSVYPQKIINFHRPPTEFKLIVTSKYSVHQSEQIYDIRSYKQF